MCVLYDRTVLFCYYVVENFAVWYFDTSGIALLAHDCFGYSGLLCFQMNFRIDFYISVKNNIEILMRIAISLCIAFGNIAIFTVLILSIHEHGRSLSNF
jgi:hypothetical protein